MYRRETDDQKIARLITKRIKCPEHVLDHAQETTFEAKSPPTMKRTYWIQIHPAEPEHKRATVYWLEGFRSLNGEEGPFSTFEAACDRISQRYGTTAAEWAVEAWT